MSLKNIKVAHLFLLLLVISPAIICRATSSQTSSPRSLDLTIYQDGVVHITYRIDVNQSHPSINTTLFGFQYENIIVIDENGTFLDYTLHVPVISIDSLGARMVRIDLDSFDLTNKTLGIWTLMIDTPVNFNITFPANTTIIELSDVPLAITSEEQHTVLTMAKGRQTISYVIRITPQEDVREILDLVATIIAHIKAEGIDVTEAEALFQQAENAYANGNYMEAEKLANDALELVYTLETKVKSFPISYYILLAVLAVSTILGILIMKRTEKIDPEKILKGYPYLRDDQKEVVRFLAEKKDGVFEAELRKVFDSPKSSMWRLIKKLEEEDIVTVTQLRQQNHIKLKKPKRDV